MRTLARIVAGLCLLVLAGCIQSETVPDYDAAALVQPEGLPGIYTLAEDRGTAYIGPVYESGFLAWVKLKDNDKPDFHGLMLLPATDGGYFAAAQAADDSTFYVHIAQRPGNGLAVTLYTFPGTETPDWPRVLAAFAARGITATSGTVAAAGGDPLTLDGLRAAFEDPALTGAITRTIYLVGTRTEALDDWRTLCARSAGALGEPDLDAGQNVYWEDLMAGLAVPACTQALAEEDSPTQHYRLGRALVKAENYDDAIGHLESAARAGYAQAYNAMGYVSANGFGVDQNDAVALKWYRQGVAAGDMASVHTLGWMIDNGRGVAADPVEALRLYQQAADAGLRDAQYAVGRAHQYGYGTAENVEEAVRYYHLSADQGYSYAQAQLGYLYAHAMGVPADLSRAVSYYEQAVAQKNAFAQTELGIMYLEGTGVAIDAEKGRALLQAAADQGDPVATERLAALGGAPATPAPEAPPQQSTPPTNSPLEDALNSEIEKLEARSAANCQALFEICGNRACTDVDDRTLYNTYDGTAWYWEDGALADESVWPAWSCAR